MTTRRYEKIYDTIAIAGAITWLKLEGHESLKESINDTNFISKEWFNHLAKLVDIYDADLNLVNESELLTTLTFILNEKFYTIAYMAVYTENGIRGYTDDGEPIYGFMECEEIKV